MVATALSLHRKLSLKVFSYLATGILLLAMLWLVFDVFVQGFGALSLDFIWQEPLNSGRNGGIFPILISTLYIVGLSLVVAMPLAIATAIFLFEWAAKGSAWASVIQKTLDLLAGVPSIVFGLFGNAFFTLALGLGFSITSGALTLACMILPTIIRTVQIGFEVVPQDINKAALSLGMSKKSTMMKIYLPISFPSLILGAVLGMARALAETAALLFTSGYVDRMPDSIMDSGRALSVHIYELAMNVPGATTNAYASALVLIVLLFIINSSAIGIGHWWITKRLAH